MTLKERRTIRKYANKDVSDELLRKLLGEAERTQTMGNLQLYSIIVTRDQQMKLRLSPCHFNQPMVAQAPVVVTICADFNRMSQWAVNRKAQPGYENFLSFMNAATDALLFTQTFSLLAEKYGLGVCYLGTTLYTPNKIIDELKLPRLVMPIATLTIGYPDETPEQTDRLPLDAVLHEEVYCDYTKEAIDKYFTEKENRSENRHFVEINHKETLAQIFTDIRYNRRDNEMMSEEFLSALKRQGFL